MPAFRRVPDEMAGGRYPLVLTPLDTSGEKPYEEFHGQDEPLVEIGLPHLLAVGSVNRRPEALSAVVERLAALISDPTRATEKTDVVAAIGGVIPDFRHRETGRSLDDRA